MPATAPALVQYSSVSELFQRYMDEYVSRSPILACCGCVIHCYEHHFIHMVKLNEAGKNKLWFPDEKPTILATKDGFGNYTHDAIRARRLLYTLDCLHNPDEVYRPMRLKTADRAYVKEFQDALPYPFTVSLVRKKGELLTLCTGQPVKRTDIRRWRQDELLWPKNTSATP